MTGLSLAEFHARTNHTAARLSGKAEVAFNKQSVKTACDQGKSDQGGHHRGIAVIAVVNRASNERSERGPRDTRSS